MYHHDDICENKKIEAQQQTKKKAKGKIRNRPLSVKVYCTMAHVEYCLEHFTYIVYIFYYYYYYMQHNGIRFWPNNNDNSRKMEAENNGNGLRKYENGFLIDRQCI